MMATSKAQSVAAYLAALPVDRRRALRSVRSVIRKHLPRGITEQMEYGMIGYSVPLARHPDTYNGRPLCFAALASQKGYMSLYLMSIYGDSGLRRWFEAAYKTSGKRLDAGKSCIRFRSVEDLPLPVIGEAVAKLSTDEFIAQYQNARSRARKRKK